MALSGDWVTPRLNDLKYLEKPPFQYGATTTVTAVFGVQESTARLWPALAAFLAVVAIGFAGIALGGRCWARLRASRWPECLARRDGADRHARFRARVLFSRSVSPDS